MLGKSKTNKLSRQQLNKYSFILILEGICNITALSPSALFLILVEQNSTLIFVFDELVSKQTIATHVSRVSVVFE